MSVVAGGGERAQDDLCLMVRAARRDMARLLRALQATGRGPSTLPDPVTTRLAHADAVTARYLLGSQGQSRPQKESEVRAAAVSMRAVDRWILERLSTSEVTALRAQAIAVRIEEHELTRPLLRADWTGDDLEVNAAMSMAERAEGRSMRFGLAQLADVELVQVCRRLGIGMDPALAGKTEGASSAPSDTLDFDPRRLSSEQAVLKTLLDGHLLAILIATLPGEAHRLLAAIVRGDLDEASLCGLADELPGRDEAFAQAAYGRHFGADVQTPAQILRGCALAFAGGPGGCLWVPVEIHRRIDGVLRAFGV